MDQLIAWFKQPKGQQLLTLVALVIVVLVVSAVVKRALTKTIHQTSSRYKVKKGVNLLAYVLLVVCVLMVYSDRLGSIGMTLGVAGAGIAFALQEVIISVAGWMSIMVTGNVAVGQRVKIGDIKGDIIDIGVLSTKIMEMGDWVNGDLYNGRMVNVSNSFVFKTEIHNYSSPFPFLWDEIVIPVRTSSDYEFARKTFQEILDDVCKKYAIASEAEWVKLANKFNVEEAKVRPMVHLSFDENWINFTLRYIVDYKLRRATKDIIFTKALDAFKAHADKMEIAASSIEVTDVPPE